MNPVALAELGVRAEKPDRLAADLEAWGLELIPLPVSAARPATKAFRKYLDRRKAAGNPTDANMPLPDFFIGAHAQAEGLPLVTRDPDRVKTYFPGVAIESP